MKLCVFDFLNETLKYLLEDIKAGFENIFVKYKFVFSIIQIKLKNIAFKHFRFKIFNHLFFVIEEVEVQVIVIFDVEEID